MKNERKYLNMAGIYKITCRDTGKIYIGKSINLDRRFREYLKISDKKIGRYFFEHVIAKHGWDSFDIEILEKFEISNKIEDNKYLINKESDYIKLFDSTNKDVGYNICKISSDRTGVKASEDTIIKIRAARLGQKHSEETKEKCRLLSLGRNFSEETKRKIGQKHKGKIVSNETREKQRSNNIGKQLSEKTKLEMSKSSLGKKKSKEHAENISKGKKGKISKLKGTTFSEERREYCREVWKKRRLKMEADK